MRRAFILILLLIGCYGVNNNTTHIGMLNTNCLGENAWEEISKQFSTNNINDTIWKIKCQEFSEQPFESNVLYFNEGPEELIGVTYSSVRYVYNPSISDDILDGMSLKLSEKEKRRICTRIQELLKKYQCD